MIYRWEQREENKNITRNESRSDILTLLTLLSVVQNWLHFWGIRHYPKLKCAISRCFICQRWLCLIYGQLAMSLRRVKRSVICKYQCFCFFDTQKWSIYLKYHFLCQRNFPINEIHLNVNCYVSALNIYSLKY